LPDVIPQRVERLMVRVLGAYYVVGDPAIQSLRDRRWSFGDIATAGNVAARSRHSLSEIVRTYEERRDWTKVARAVGVPPAQIYMALNAPRAVQVGDLDSGLPVAEVPIPRPPEAPRNGGRRPDTAPTERVAGARMEFVRPEPGELLRRAIALYYALPPATLRSLEARGWELEEILVAGNLFVRSEASFSEIVAFRDLGRDWPAIARQIGVDVAEIYQPTIPRRATGRRET
jgi:hypothetical protein